MENIKNSNFYIYKIIREKMLQKEWMKYKEMVILIENIKILE